MVELGAKERPELLVTGKSVGALHGNQPLRHACERQCDINRRRAAETSIRFSLIDPDHDHRYHRRTARYEVIGIAPRLRRRKEEGGVKPMRLGEREFEESLDYSLQPLHRIVGPNGADDLLPCGEAVIHQRVQEGTLIGEVPIHRHGRDASARGDLAHRKPLDPLVLENGPGGGEDAIFAHVYSVREYAYAVHINSAILFKMCERRR